MILIVSLKVINLLLIKNFYYLRFIDFIIVPKLSW